MPSAPTGQDIELVLLGKLQDRYCPGPLLLNDKCKDDRIIHHFLYNSFLTVPRYYRKASPSLLATFRDVRPLGDIQILLGLHGVRPTKKRTKDASPG